MIRKIMPDQEKSNIDIDNYISNLRSQFPNLPRDEDTELRLRNKLREQLIEKVAIIQIKEVDLKYILIDIKNNLSEYFWNSVDSKNEPNGRRTPCLKKARFQSKEVNISSDLLKIEEKKVNSDKDCCSSKDQLNNFVQVETLPDSASNNLITIYVPTILKEQMSSCKYNISINLNRLDLTRKILESSIKQQAIGKEKAITKPNENINSNDNLECKITYEMDNEINTVRLVCPQNDTINLYPQVEVKPTGDSCDSRMKTPSKICIKSSSIVLDANKVPPTEGKKTALKRKSFTPKDPPKKRGRKPGSKNKSKNEKSDLAKYVEMFKCNGGSPSPVSQTVTSTTQWDILPEQSGQIAYFLNGEWSTLNTPINSVRQMVSTINQNMAPPMETDTYIPFEDFVNYIENPSLTPENNVIARVLEGTAENILNTQEKDIITLEVPTSFKSARSSQNIETLVSVETISRDSDTGGISDNSKKIESTSLVSAQKNESYEENATKTNVIFSTGRSMPSLDDMNEDLLCSTPQQNTNIERTVVFSMASTSVHATIKSPECDSNFSCEKVDADKSKSKELSDKDKYKSEEIKGLSLLEIEKNFNNDSLLDFDNCIDDDDLLSLAPSYCFNTPMDDRFADSAFLDVDDSKIEPLLSDKDSNYTTRPVPRNHLEYNLPKRQDEDLNPTLKSFKIPRIKQIIEETHTVNSKNQVTKCTNIGPKENTKKNNPSFHILVNSSKMPSLSTIISSGKSDNCIATNISNNVFSVQDIPKIFGSPCFGYLADKCFDTTCKFNHKPLDIPNISVSLFLLRNEVLNNAYRFIWRHHLLFKLYFPIFCEEYARRNIRRKLSTMINDCDMQPNCTHFIQIIFSNLITSGLNSVNACRFILNRAKGLSHAAINVFMEIIIDTDAVIFASTIEKFAEINGYKFRMKHINEMAKACLRSGSADLLTVLIKCLISVDQTEFVTMRSPELIQLLEMVKNNNFNGM